MPPSVSPCAGRLVGRIPCYKDHMARLVEFTTGLWLDGLGDDLSHEVQTLAHFLPQGVLDAVLALAMFEQSCQMSWDSGHESWERDRQLERAREEELLAADPRDFGSPDYFEWRGRISEQARGDVVRQKWDTGELPRELQHRLPFLHAETFVTALARVRRTLQVLCDTGVDTTGEIARACADFDAGVPALKAVRDSVEHAEDRMRGRNRKGQMLTLAPVTNSAIHAPGGGALIGGILNDNRFGWTVDDGTYQEVEVSDATVEAARTAVQAALDALPWKPGRTRQIPAS